MKSYIKAISTYFPKNTLTNDTISEQFPEWNSEKILQKIGIEQRYIADKDECASDMAAQAVLTLIEEHHLDKTPLIFFYSVPKPLIISSLPQLVLYKIRWDYLLPVRPWTSTKGVLGISMDYPWPVA
jgi:beta-ketoacyl-acyl-carrier-protein synthase III